MLPQARQGFSPDISCNPAGTIDCCESQLFFPSNGFAGLLGSSFDSCSQSQVSLSDNFHVLFVSLSDNFHVLLMPTATNTMRLEYSLEVLEHQVTTAKERNAWVIYWHHLAHGFTWWNEEDQQEWRGEMNRIRTHIQEGHVTTVTSGETLKVNGNLFFPMEVTFKEKCWPYMMLRRRGFFNDADHTPYLFTDEQSRDAAVQFINREQGSSF